MAEQHEQKPLGKSDLLKFITRIRKMGTTIISQGSTGPTLIEKASVELAYSIYESSEKLSRLTKGIIVISSIMAFLVVVQIVVQVWSIYWMGFLSN
jgi:putative effector of murein hydrolase